MSYKVNTERSSVYNVFQKRSFISKYSRYICSYTSPFVVHVFLQAELKKQIKFIKQKFSVVRGHSQITYAFRGKDGSAEGVRSIYSKKICHVFFCTMGGGGNIKFLSSAYSLCEWLLKMN